MRRHQSIASTCGRDMKNHDFGDQNDYFKYDLLIFPAEELSRIEKLSIVWMLTEDDDSQGGGRSEYLRGPWRQRTFPIPEAIPGRGGRKVARIKDYFKGTGRGLGYCPYGAEKRFLHRDRSVYFEQIPAENLINAVVFLDPDNAQEVKSATERNFHKYVKFEEVKSVYDKMSPDSCLVIYQRRRHLSFVLS